VCVIETIRRLQTVSVESSVERKSECVWLDEVNNFVLVCFQPCFVFHFIFVIYWLRLNIFTADTVTAAFGRFRIRRLWMFSEWG
jgi:hypothetical protein